MPTEVYARAAIAGDPVISSSVRALAKSLQSISYTLISDLHDAADLVATVAWVKAELERLADESEVLATRLHEIEQATPIRGADSCSLCAHARNDHKTHGEHACMRCPCAGFKQRVSS